jgi:hypothetical protein
MGRRLTKKQKAYKKKQKKAKKIRKLEAMDAKGLSRKKWKFTYSPQRFLKIKAIAIILIPIVYIVYSPLLVVVMFLYMSLFYFAIGTERSMNKSVIKSNHIKIPKYDSAIALLLVVIGFLGSIFGVSNGRIGRFSNTFWSKVSTSMTNFGSLLTGNRKLFGNQRGFGFGTAPKPPEGFVANASEFSDTLKGAPPAGGGRPDFDVDISNIPIEFMFSQILSTVQTVLIFSVVGIGIFSLWMTYRKMKKFELEINEIVLDGDIEMITDDEIDKIISFGVDEKA